VKCSKLGGGWTEAAFDIRAIIAFTRESKSAPQRHHSTVCYTYGRT